jgi:hypothetical protein
MLDVMRTDERSRTFPSLQSLVAEARARLCRPGMIADCIDSIVRASTEGQRVVLTLRDSTTIVRLFGLRPPTATVYRGRPEDGNDTRSATVRIEYVAPQIPVPDSAFRADAARRLRRYEASVNWIKRWITIGNRSVGSTAILEVGDSATLGVGEMHCRHDACSSSPFAAPDSGWAVDDTSIVRLRPPRASTGAAEDILHRTPRPAVVGLRPGRSTVQVRGLHAASDTMPSREPVASALQRELIVTSAIGRVEVLPHIDTVRVGERVEFRARVTDRAGQTIDGLPVEWRLQNSAYSQIGEEQTPRSITFDTRGTQTIVARVGSRSDSLVVIVVGPRKP